MTDLRGSANNASPKCSRFRSALCLVSALALSWGVAAKAAPALKSGTQYSYFEVGNVQERTPGKAHFGLLLAGGGAWDERAFGWFAAQAAHGHIVIISASGGAEAGEQFFREIGGVASVQTIEFHSREAAYDPTVLTILRRADGIFVLGGDQSNYVRYWKDTPVARLLDEHARSKPIGGTSAGLAILGSASYGAMDGGSIDSATALSDPEGTGVTIVRNFLHMPFLRHVITDTHFTARNRLGRLIAFLAQIRSKYDTSSIGLGIDESSALTVDANGQGRFYSKSHGLAYLVQPQGLPKSAAHEPLTYAAVRVTGCDEAGVIDMRTLQVHHPAFSEVVTVRAGQMVSRPDASYVAKTR